MWVVFPIMLITISLSFNEHGDINSFVDSIFKIVEEDSEWDKRSHSAREYSVNNLSLELIAKKTIEIYNNIP